MLIKELNRQVNPLLNVEVYHVVSAANGVEYYRLIGNCIVKYSSSWILLSRFTQKIGPMSLIVTPVSQLFISAPTNLFPCVSGMKPNIADLFSSCSPNMIGVKSSFGVSMEKVEKVPLFRITFKCYTDMNLHCVCAFLSLSVKAA